MEIKLKNLKTGEVYPATHIKTEVRAEVYRLEDGPRKGDEIRMNPKSGREVCATIQPDLYPHVYENRDYIPLPEIAKEPTELDLALAQAGRDALEITELKAYICELEALIDKQTAEMALELTERVNLRRFEIYDGKLDIALQGEIIPLMAANFARFFDISGAENALCLQYELTDNGPNERRRFELTIQKVGGKTMADLKREERERAEAIKAELLNFCEEIASTPHGLDRFDEGSLLRKWRNHAVLLTAKYTQGKKI
jgi:hypothetical protein